MVGEGEEFDRQSLCVGNVDNSQPPSNKIVIGELSPHLRLLSGRREGLRSQKAAI